MRKWLDTAEKFFSFAESAKERFGNSTHEHFFFYFTKRLSYDRFINLDYLHVRIKMRNSTIKPSSDFLHKIEAIEDQLFDLKLSALKELIPSKKKIISLKGILKGVNISDSDIEDAKASLYSKIKI